MLKVTFVFDNEYTIATTLLQTLKYSFSQKKRHFWACIAAVRIIVSGILK